MTNEMMNEVWVEEDDDMMRRRKRSGMETDGGVWMRREWRCMAVLLYVGM
jgi:hypothetical protein